MKAVWVDVLVVVVVFCLGGFFFGRGALDFTAQVRAEVEAVTFDPVSLFDIVGR